MKISFPGAKKLSLYLLDEKHDLSLIAGALCDTMETVLAKNTVLLAEAQDA